MQGIARDPERTELNPLEIRKSDSNPHREISTLPTENRVYIAGMGGALSLDETFQPIRAVAARIGVPAAWLRAEAEAGRVPHIRAGRQILISPQQAELVLLRRAEAVTDQHHNEAQRCAGGQL